MGEIKAEADPAIGRGGGVRPHAPLPKMLAPSGRKYQTIYMNYCHRDPVNI